MGPYRPIQAFSQLFPADGVVSNFLVTPIHVRFLEGHAPLKMIRATVFKLDSDPLQETRLKKIMKITQRLADILSVIHH